jgi:hypothetical protein
MPSRLATALLALPRPQGLVSDLLWRHSDPLTAATAGAIPSDEVVKELATFTGNEAATAIGKLLPTPAACLIAAVHGSSHIHEGIVANPAAGRDSLESIASARSSASQAAQARLNRIADALTAASSGADLSEFVAQPDVAVARALVDAGFEDSWTDAVFASNNTAAHFTCYRRADASIAERIAIGVIEKKMSVNYELASWLVSDTGIVADTLRAAIEADDRLRRRCSDSAERTLVRAGLMAKERTMQPAGAVSVDMIRTLRMMGSPASECAALVINNGTADVPSDLVVDLLAECSNGMVSQFLSGTSNRHPRQGEVTGILDRFDHERISAVAEMIDDAVERVDWATELLLAFPRRKLDGLSTVAVADLDSAITAQLADTPARWEFLLTLSEEWEQSLASLIDAALAMDIDD